jgi:hypothetical protein
LEKSVLLEDISEGGEDDMKKFTATSTSHNGWTEMGPYYYRGFVYADSASQWCKVEFTASYVRTYTSTDLSGAWTASENLQVVYSGSWAHSQVGGCMRVEIDGGGAGTDRIHLAFVLEDSGGGDEVKLAYWYSDDGGTNWTKDYSDVADDWWDKDVSDVRDVFTDGTDVFTLVYQVTNDQLDIVDLSDFSIVISHAGDDGFGGYMDGTDYYYVVVDDGAAPDDWKLYYFDGAANLVETIVSENLFAAGHRAQLMHKGNVTLMTGIFAGPLIKKYVKYGTDDWTTINLLASDPRIAWEETDDNEPRFIGDSGANGIYYITPAGSFVKIHPNASVTQNGYGKYLYPYEIEPESYDPASKVPIVGGHFIPQTVNFTHVGTDYVKGDGIVLTDDSSNVKFIGNIPPEGGIKMVGTKMQNLTFFSPGKFDLMEKVTYDFSAQTVPQMLTTDLLETRYYYKGTFSAAATTYNYNCNQLPRWEFWKDLEELSLLKIHKSNETGQIDLDNGFADDSGAVTTHANQVVKPIIETQGAGFNRVMVLGGPKEDLTGLAIGVYDIPTATDQQINLVTYVKPNLLTDALCLTAATNIGDTVNSALIRYTFTMTGQGKPLEGEYISFAYAPLGIGAVNVTVESYTHELLSGWFSCTCYNALHWRGI